MINIQILSGDIIDYRKRVIKGKQLLLFVFANEVCQFLFYLNISLPLFLEYLPFTQFFILIYDFYFKNK
jgi:hypothetical protein